MAANEPGEAIGSRLLGDADVKADAGTRVFPSKPDMDAVGDGDYVVFYRTGGGDGKRLANRRSTRGHIFRVEAHAKDDQAAQRLLTSARRCLDGWSDRVNRVQGCFAVGDADDLTDEDGRQVSGQSFEIFFSGD